MDRPEIHISPIKPKRRSIEIEEVHDCSLKPLNSMKNVYELKKIHLQDAFMRVQQMESKLHNLKKLKDENEHLARSFNILKDGAMLALQQKQSSLQQLKCLALNTDYDHLEHLEKEFEFQKELKKQCEMEIRELQSQLGQERQIYQTELEQKERIIEELAQQLNQCRQIYEQLETEHELRVQQIKFLQEENSNLYYELEVEQKALSKCTCSTSRQSLLSGSIENLNTLFAKPDHTFSTNILENEVQSVDDTAKISSLEQQHKQKIASLTDFYERRIKYIKKLFQNELKSRKSVRKSTLQAYDFQANFVNDLEEVEEIVTKSQIQEQDRNERDHFSNETEYRGSIHNLRDEIGNKLTSCKSISKKESAVPVEPSASLKESQHQVFTLEPLKMGTEEAKSCKSSIDRVSIKPALKTTRNPECQRQKTEQPKRKTIQKYQNMSMKIDAASMTEELFEGIKIDKAKQILKDSCYFMFGVVTGGFMKVIYTHMFSR